MAKSPIPFKLAAGTVVPEKINIFDQSRYEIISVESFGANEKLEALKAAHPALGAKRGKDAEDMTDYISNIASRDKRAIEGFKKLDDGAYADVFENILKLKEGHKALSLYFPPDELEPLPGFVGILLANNDEELKASHDGFVEKLVYVKDRATKTVLGGTNFAMYADRANNAATSQINYTFVANEYRQRGIAEALTNTLVLGQTEEFAKQKGMVSPQVLAFTEQNSPLKMTFEEYGWDVKSAMDPCDRLKAWKKIGALPADFRYVQPPLEEGLGAVLFLDYNVHPRPQDKAHYVQNGVDSKILARHMKSFMDLSVLGEANAYEGEEYCQNMQKEFDATKSVKLLDADWGAVKKDVYAVFDLVRMGVIPKQGDDKSIGAYITEYKDLVRNHANFLSPEAIRKIQSDMRHHGAAAISPVDLEPVPGVQNG